MPKALIIVDVLNDFLPGGNLPVPNGDEVIKPINDLIDNYEFVVAVKDTHPMNHKSFVENGGSWASHCVEGSYGCEFPEDLRTSKLHVVRKGTNAIAESYSGFEDETGYPTGLAELLQTNQIDAVDVVGLALDYCVYHTAVDAVKAGFKTSVILSGCRGFEPVEITAKKLQDNGVTIEN